MAGACLAAILAAAASQGFALITNHELFLWLILLDRIGIHSLMEIRWGTMLGDEQARRPMMESVIGGTRGQWRREGRAVVEGGREGRAMAESDLGGDGPMVQSGMGQRGEDVSWRSIEDRFWTEPEYEFGF